MNWDLITLIVFPYVAIAIAVVVGIIRYRNRQFTHSSYSTQFLEGKIQFWGSVPWHYGISLVLVGHFIALFFPSGILAWNGSPVRLLVLEGTGLAFGIFAMVGLVVLIYRRFASRRVASVTTTLNLILLFVLLIQVVAGIGIALSYKWGSSWGAGSLTPYVWSILTLRPDTDYLATMPFLVKLHVFTAFLIFLLLPFTPLVHFLSIPLKYFVRPPQVVIWNRPRTEGNS